MGGGFGGCTINLVKEELYSTFVSEVRKRYFEVFGKRCIIHDVVIGDGARRLI
jgi:galactokinase